MRLVGLLAVAVLVVVYSGIADSGLLSEKALSEKVDLQRNRFKILHEWLNGELK